MATFYKPFVRQIEEIDVIIYPMVALEEVFERNKPDVLIAHLVTLYKNNPTLCTGAYHVVIVWNDSGNIMTDVWQFTSLESAETGFTVDVKTFKGQELIIGNGISASDGLIMLGRECELEEKLRKEGKSLEEYINGARALLPKAIAPKEEF